MSDSALKPLLGRPLPTAPERKYIASSTSGTLKSLGFHSSVGGFCKICCKNLSCAEDEPKI